MENLNEILKKYWNIENLKDKQYELISNYLEGKGCNWIITNWLW
jgi:hypothetical protein